MKTIGQYRTRFFTTLALAATSIATLLGATAAQAAPTDQLELIGQYQTVYVDGYHFVTNGQPVTLRAFGLAGGQKVFLGSVQRTPDVQTGNLGWEFMQAGDPCTGGGYAQIEVDAFLPRFALAQTASATIRQQAVQARVITAPFLSMTEIATATTTVGCPIVF